MKSQVHRDKWASVAWKFNDPSQCKHHDMSIQLIPLHFTLQCTHAIN